MTFFTKHLSISDVVYNKVSYFFQNKFGIIAKVKWLTIKGINCIYLPFRTNLITLQK